MRKLLHYRYVHMPSKFLSFTFRKFCYKKKDTYLIFFVYFYPGYEQHPETQKNVKNKSQTSRIKAAKTARNLSTAKSRQQVTMETTPLPLIFFKKWS